MATEFNFRRAHREWAQPEFDKLSDEIKAVWRLVVAVSGQLKQEQHLGVEFGKHENIRVAMLECDPEALCRSAVVIYYWGHWAHTKGYIVRCGDMPEKRFGFDNDFDVWEGRFEAKACVEELNVFPGPTAEMSGVRAGPDNEASAGAYWKYKRLVETLCAQQKWNVYPKTFEKEMFDSRKFMDHKPGTDYSNEEMPVMLSEPLPRWIAVEKCVNANYDPHVPVIGRKTMEWAGDRDGSIGDSAPCSHPGCNLQMNQHKSDRIAVLKINRDVKASELAEVLGEGTEFAKRMDEHKFDGFAFVKSEFEIEQDVPPPEKEKDPASIWKGDKLIHASGRPTAGLTKGKVYTAASDQFEGDFPTRPYVKVVGDDGELHTCHVSRFVKVQPGEVVADGD